MFFFFFFFLQQGQVHEKKHEFQEALVCYQNALSINPYHTKSLRHLVRELNVLEKGNRVFIHSFIYLFIFSHYSLSFPIAIVAAAIEGER